MDLKKYIRQKSEEDAEKLFSEGDEQFCHTLAEQAGAAPHPQLRKPKYKFWAWISSAVAIVAAAVITTVVLLNNSPIYYQIGDIEKVGSNIEQLQNDSKYFTVSEREEVIEVGITLSYDSKSGDKLYYNFSTTYKAEANIAKVDLTIVINKNYHHTFDMEDSNTKALSDYTVIYETVERPEAFGYYYRGRINVKTETVYLEYRLLMGFDDEIFFNEIQKLVQLKK